jgi:hypothetical protein
VTERKVSSERVSGELRDAIAAIIAGNVDESRFYNAPAFQRAATEVILALRSSVKTAGEAWSAPAAAPKDGTMLRLLIKPDADTFTSFEDSTEPYVTIGFNQFADTQDDEWHFAGWDWSHDCITQGRGEVIGWQAFTHPSPIAPSEYRRTFTIPDGHEAVRDANGRATGETRPMAPSEVTDEMVDRAHKAQMSELFLRCQPDRGDVFSFMDDRKDVMRAALTAALKGGK